ncbi:receptor-like protein 12, partial [Tanacetum coccineum]
VSQKLGIFEIRPIFGRFVDNRESIDDSIEGSIIDSSKGVIPKKFGQLKALYLFNVSHNEFTGSIPQSMGNLSQMEALNTSWNKLTGNIPSSFTSLNFLSNLNLSYNQLEGRIPASTQLQSFEKYSFIGNKCLCGPPLDRTYTSSAVLMPPSSPNSDTSSDGNDWQTFFYGMEAVAAVLYIYKANTSSTTRQTRYV